MDSLITVSGDIKTKAFEMIEALADKLDTTMDHLWDLLVRQAYVEAMTLFPIATLILGIGLFLIFRLKDRFDWEDSDYIVHCILGYIAGVVATGIAVGMFVAIARLLINPEYWALQQILEQI